MTPQRIIERLEEIEDWQLTPQQWDTVGDVLKSLGAVLAEGDDTGTVHVLARLEPLERAGRPAAHGPGWARTGPRSRRNSGNSGIT
ncbi:hypothetical protein L1856_08700 [Streptomyces sp. Tue 6430]|nr:hypothetical protein [Streptomyces sp. Tue 6430]